MQKNWIIVILFVALGSIGKAQLPGTIQKKAEEILRPFILREAQWALRQEPITVTSFPAARSQGGLHDFYSEGDYWWPDPRHNDSPYIRKDGLTNPDNFTRHRDMMIRFSRIVGALASAYQLTADARYARHAIRHCNAWLVDTATIMTPSLLYAQAIKGRVSGRGIGIIDAIHLMEVVKGIESIGKAGYIDRVTYKQYQEWFSRYLHWVTTHAYGLEERDGRNNHGTCWVMQVAVFARFTGQQHWMEYCRNRYKEVLLPQQMAVNGSFPLELERTKPFGYSLFNLDAMTTICQTLSTEADDLYEFALSDGRSIHKGIAFLFPFINNKELWPFATDVMYGEHWPVAQPALLFGAIRFQKHDWADTWSRLDHVVTEPEIVRNLPVRYPLLWIN